MAQTLSFTPLSLDLPSSRMSVDFSTLATDFSTLTTPQSKINSEATPSRRPDPYRHKAVQRRPVRQADPLPEVEEEPEPTVPVPALGQQNGWKWLWRKPVPDRSEPLDAPMASLGRKISNASSASVSSTNTTGISSIFSAEESNSTARTSRASSLYSNPFDSAPKEATTLDTLPLSLLEHIIEYTLCLPLTVSIGPQDSNNRHMQYRYHRAGLDYMDIQLIIKHPLFMVSRFMRETTLDVFHRRCDFVIDLHRIYHTKVSSTINENLKNHQKFWLNDTPKMVRNSMQSLSKLHIRLPVASTEASVRRGRDETDWMDGSDGKGGGSWRVKSMKKEQEDALEIQECLEAIKDLLMADPGSSNRPRANSLSHTLSIRRTKSGRNLRSKSAEYPAPPSNPSLGGEASDGKRKPLKRMEVVLVKRSSQAMVLPESLGLIRALRSVPVTGFTKYHFELEGQKLTWATKHKKRWRGMEPDGQRFLRDMQGLTVTEKPLEPIQTPKEFRFVDVSRAGQLQLSDSAIQKTPIVLEKPVKNSPDLPLPPITPKSSGFRMPWSRKKGHSRKDSFTHIMEEGMNELGASDLKYQPPTVEELRKIADDIRNGLY